MDSIQLFVIYLSTLFSLPLQAFSSQEKQNLVKIALDVSPSGKLPKGKTEIPFEFPLEIKEGVKYFETYHGIMVNVRYSLTCEVPRGLFSKTLKKSIEVLIIDYVCVHWLLRFTPDVFLFTCYGYRQKEHAHQTRSILK